MINARLTRGAALVAITIAVPLGAQVPARVRDTLYVRTASPDMRARLDSINVLFRALENETPMSPEFMRIRKQLEEATTALAADNLAAAAAHHGPVRMMLQAPEGGHDITIARAAAQPVRVRGWIGVNTGFAPFTDSVRDGDYLVRYFEHPSIISVEPNSPAEQAGIAPGDVLLAYDGLDVVGRWVDVSRMLEPERKLSVKVARDGDPKTYTLTVAHTPEMIRARRAPEFRIFNPSAMETMVMPRPSSGAEAVMIPDMPSMSGFSGMFAARGLFGANLTSVNDALAKALGIPTGLLVNEVPEATPAYRAGLRAGDVIVKADGQPIASVNQLIKVVMMHASDQSVPVDIVRNHKAKKLTLDW